jgi:hypothetical protein
MAEKKKDEEVTEVTIESEASAPTPKAKFDWTSLNTLAVVSLASAISGIGALIAVITGHISLAQIKRSGENGRTLALTGTVLGYVHLAGWIIFVLLGVISKALLFGHYGLQPMGPDMWFEYRNGFDGMQMWQDR